MFPSISLSHRKGVKPATLHFCDSAVDGGSEQTIKKIDFKKYR